MSESSGGFEAAEVGRFRRLSFGWRVVVVALTTVAVLLSINQLFNLHLLVGFTMLDNAYLYLLLGLLVPQVYLTFPAYKGASLDRVPWYDAVLFVVLAGVCAYFFAASRLILSEGWEYAAPTHVMVLGLILWVLILEAVRRAGGLVIFSIILIFSLYPLYADKLPQVIGGASASLFDTAAFHATSEESVLGIPMRAFGELVFGFLLFGAALQYTGGGRFFIDLSFALLGHVRGGPAKVAIFASGLMGSMSGSVISNVLTTGSMSIPAMKRTGFSARYAGGVEACASTGAVLMPPIMGATAFVMASFLNIPYVEVAVAAIIPSVLYYLGLFVQIDSYAARVGLVGLPREELPKITQVIKDGWYYIAVFATLVWMLIYLQREAIAPYYATALLLVINQILPKHRLDRMGALKLVEGIGQLLSELSATLAGIGLIVGGLFLTGMAGTLVNDLVFIAGGSPYLLLLTGAITSFILGMGMTVTAAYIFLAIILAPALVKVGLDPLAVHLFMLYWGMISFITPPVALGAYAAASIAKANPMSTGFEAMRLGSIIYFIPFFFVLNPALILHGTLYSIVTVFSTAVIGVVLIASALQGYVAGVGPIGGGPVGWLTRALIVLGGMLFAVPGGKMMGISSLELAGIAVVICVPVLGFTAWRNRTAGVIGRALDTPKKAREMA
jgi:TRAP transporter 4TM/12TM fusion protein